MRRIASVLALVLLAAGAGAWWAHQRASRRPDRPDGPALVHRLREIARLETLELHVSKVVSYQPDPPPAQGLAGELLSWAAWSLRPREGRALVFATARVGLDLERLDARAVNVAGDVVEVVLPPLRTTIELDPGRTQVLKSNLDSDQTAQLLDKARRVLEAEVQRDRDAAEKARASAERAIRRLLVQLGFRTVRFVDAPPAPVRSATAPPAPRGA